MLTALKKGAVQMVCRFWEESPLLEKLLQEKKIVPVPPGVYQVLSLETDGIHCQIVYDGDFVKLDAYPNDAELFEEAYMDRGKHLHADSMMNRRKKK